MQGGVDRAATATDPGGSRLVTAGVVHKLGRSREFGWSWPVRCLCAVASATGGGESR